MSEAVGVGGGGRDHGWSVRAGGGGELESNLLDTVSTCLPSIVFSSAAPPPSFLSRYRPSHSTPDILVLVPPQLLLQLPPGGVLSL